MSKSSLNAHWAFHDDPKRRDFLRAITIAEQISKGLIQVRNTIRSAIREGLGNWGTVIAKDQLFEHEFLRKSHTAAVALRPRFRMQGSFAYKTVNDPARKSQQIDLDDGVYMPTEFIQLRSGNRPILASKGYFQAVEAILKPLCDKKGWKLISKSSCVRIKISSFAHVDLPLYAIPQAQFVQITEHLAKQVGTVAADSLRDSEELSDQFYKQLPTDQIMLAHRENGWEPSDPRKIEDWYERAIETHGEILRRTSRYFKAWRDFEWQDSKLSSLAIMSCVVDVLDGLDGDLRDDRDDIAMLGISERFAERLNQPIPNPIMPHLSGIALDRDWKPEDRSEIVSKATELHKRLADALHGTDDAERALAGLRAALGERISDDTSVIRVGTPENTIRQFPKVVVAAPTVGRSISG